MIRRRGADWHNGPASDKADVESRAIRSAIDLANGIAAARAALDHGDVAGASYVLGDESEIKHEADTSTL